MKEEKLQQFYYKKNRFQQLKGFYHVVQEGGITKAANKMGLTQSAITLQIQSLERDLETKLFKRNLGSFILTDDGKILYELSVPHIHAIDSIHKNFLQNRQVKENKRVNIAMHHVAVSYLMPKYINKFNSIHQDTTIGIYNISYKQALDDALADKIDLLIYPNIFTPIGFEGLEFASFDPILIMHKDHPLAKKKKIGLRDISKYNTVRIDKNLIALPIFEETFRQFGFKSNVEFKNANWDIIKHFVKNNVGLGFVSTLCISDDDINIRYHNLKDYFPVMNYKIIFKKGKILSDNVVDLIEIIKSSKYNNSVIF